MAEPGSVLREKDDSLSRFEAFGVALDIFNDSGAAPIRLGNRGEFNRWGAVLPITAAAQQRAENRDGDA
jgi:hypothetical protein